MEEKDKTFLINSAKGFSIAIIEMCEKFATKKCRDIISNQIMRSATSIGANISEAKYTHSRADFIAKMEIALKENNETEYWLELAFRSGLIDGQIYKIIKQKSDAIKRMLISSITTAKKNSNTI